MPEGRSWIVASPDARKWEIKTAREGEVYFRPLEPDGRPKGGWRHGLPPIDPSILPVSLREVLDLFTASHSDSTDEPC